jgi:competence protein ComFC
MSWGELLLPNECLGCHRLSKDLVCETCRKSVTLNLRELNSDVFSVFILSEYEGVIKTLLTKLKFYGWQKIGTLLSVKIDEACSTLDLSSYDGLVIMPSHWLRIFWRGCNQVDLLFASLCQNPKSPCSVAVKRVRYTKRLFGLDADAREKELSDAFELSADVRGQRLLVLDDIVTTGASIRALRQCLVENGAIDVHALCLAESKSVN